ncbi:MHO_1580 family protein [Metamycoplasma buccale]|uniref:MHO_1580 family protein n=1 Tax=Metamycoplasma buccale TaxID=55602 RepID=UPI00398F0C75
MLNLINTENNINKPEIVNLEKIEGNRFNYKYGIWNSGKMTYYESDNFILNKYPIYLNIKRNFNDGSAIITLKIPTIFPNIKFNFDHTVVGINRELVNLENHYEENGYHHYEIYKYQNGKKIIFNNVNLINIFSYRKQRTYFNLKFGFVYQTIWKNEFKENEINLAKNKASWNYVYEIDYKIDQSSINTDMFIDKNTKIKMLKVSLDFSNPKMGEGWEKLGTISYKNYEHNTKKILPMNEKLYHAFQIKKFQTDSLVENHDFNILDNDLNKEDDIWKLNLTNKIYSNYIKNKKAWDITQNEGLKGYYLPLNFRGDFKGKLHIENKFNPNLKTLDFSQIVYQKYFDYYDGLIHLNIDKSNYKIDENLFTKNKWIEKNLS